MLESSLIVAKNTNLLLKKEKDHLQQYQQRVCIVHSGIKPADGETEDQNKEKKQNVLVQNLVFNEERVNSEINTTD